MRSINVKRLFSTLVAILFLTSMMMYAHAPAHALADSTLVVKPSTFTSADIDPETVAELWDMYRATYRVGEKGRIYAIHQIRNAEFKALLYRNMRAVYIYADEWDMFVANDWVLKDVNGDYVYSTRWTNNYMVDIGNARARAWVANWIKECLDSYGFDGVYADCSLSVLAGEHFWGVSADPINPRTETYWTDQEVRQALIALHKKVKEIIGGKLLVCNGIFHGHRFWKRYGEYMEIMSKSPLEGLMSEGLWYQYNGAWMSEERWLESLDFLVFIQDNFLRGRPNRLFVPACKMATPWEEEYPLPSGCTKEQMVIYAFASTLLGIKTSQNYLRITGDPAFMRDVVQPLHDIDVGAPVNNYYVIKGTHVYARDFTYVKVLVNPTGTPYTIALGSSYTTRDGQTVRTITMQPHTGEILREIFQSENSPL